MDSIIDLSSKEAYDFFLKDESYCRFSLPYYFDFQPILRSAENHLDGSRLKDYYSDSTPRDFESVNQTVLYNKNGRFSWRLLQLVHPALYITLADKITEKENWSSICNRLDEFQHPLQISSHGIPVQSSNSQDSDTAAAVTNWWQSIEQQSIELSLSFEYIFHTDISNCYGSIYTHSIPWAIHTKPLMKKTENRGDTDFIGNFIDEIIQDMSHGQTNGIPQGNALMDFLAEIVLGYADISLYERLKKSGIHDYRILRYRDDYRVFTNSIRTGQKIIKELSDVLFELNMELNPEKTSYSKNVIEDSIKPGKLHWLLSKQEAKNLRKHILIINRLSNKYPNSGVLKKALDSFYDRIRNEDTTPKRPSVLISIVVDIAYRNPNVYPLSAAIISEILPYIERADKRSGILSEIRRKFSNLPNTGHLSVWLQRITIGYDIEEDFSHPLCKKVNEPSTCLWNSQWISGGLKQTIDETSIVDDQKVDEAGPQISPDVTKLFSPWRPY